MNGDNGTSTPHNQQLRALLFTDLCDSLLLVERIGDVAAAELFQGHDRLVLALLQRWNGQLIDRSDGLFMLFERPIDALGFALDYQRGLQPLGQSRDLRLQARAGLHVGEVILWNNSAESVALGSKAVEVEGLAKPMAARLMQLARPGQLLLSAAAESLVRRAASQLGEPADRLYWKSFGRWRFRGVAQPMEVIGVSAVGKAALRRPRASDKARPDVPFWRRPMAMAAQVTLVAACAMGLWLLTRPQPAIAFAERDWVVIAEPRNLTGDPLLSESINQAFRISLEQSRYVNVLSDLKVRDTMQRMLISPGAGLDRGVASEVAQRDGARAVLAPSVLEVHGRLRVAVDVIDPSTAATVYTVHVDGKGLDSLLASTDEVVGRLRERLGEGGMEIDRHSVNLPQVATSSLDALRAYAAGIRALDRRQTDEALGFLAQAVKVDPEFAMAHVAIMRIHWMRGESRMALDAHARAQALRARLTPRDALYLDGWAGQASDLPEADIARRWKLLTDLYPDYHGGYVNRALALSGMGRYAEAVTVVQPARVPQAWARSHTLDFSGRLKLAAGNTNGAVADFRMAGDVGGWRTSANLATAMAVLGDWSAARAQLVGVSADDFGARMQQAAVLVDLGELDKAEEVARSLQAQCNEPALCRLASAWRASIAGMAGERSDPAASRKRIGEALADLRQQPSGNLHTRQFMVLGLIRLAQREGVDVTPQLRLARRAIDLRSDPRSRQLLDIIEATRELHAGQAVAAVERLLPWADGTELYQLHVALRDARHASGDSAAAAAEARWLAAHRGRAYAEDSGNYILQALNVRDSRAPLGAD